MQRDRLTQCNLNGHHKADGDCRVHYRALHMASLLASARFTTVPQPLSWMLLCLSLQTEWCSFLLLPTPQFLKVQNTKYMKLFLINSTIWEWRTTLSFPLKQTNQKNPTLRLILAHFWALWPLILHLLYLLRQFSAPFSFHVPNTFLFWYYLW